MLTPEQLLTLGDELFPLLAEMQNEILADIAERIYQDGFLSATDEWQLLRLEAITGHKKQIRKILAEYTGYTEKEIKAVFREAGYTSADSDFKKYEVAYKAGIIKNKPVHILNTIQGQQIYEAALRKSQDGVKQLTKSLLTNYPQFIRAVDKAHLKVIGGMSDPVAESRKIVRKLAESYTKVTYESGHRDFVDVAVWRAVRTDAAQTAGSLSMLNFDMMGGNLLKTTAHAGARPSHAEWQGETFWVHTPDDRFRSFEVTGYGTGPGLKGWHCRHDCYPVFDGLDDLNALPTPKNPAGLTDDEYYNATQKARRYERNIRSLKREKHMFHAAKDLPMERRLTTNIKNKITEYEKFMDEHGMPPLYERLSGQNYWTTRHNKDN